MGNFKISLRGKAAERGMFAFMELNAKLNCNALSQSYKEELIKEFLEKYCTEVQVDSNYSIVEIIGR